MKNSHAEIMAFNREIKNQFGRHLYSVRFLRVLHSKHNHISIQAKNMQNFTLHYDPATESLITQIDGKNHSCHILQRNFRQHLNN